MYKHKIIMVLTITLLMLFSSMALSAATKTTSEKEKSEQLQRSASGLFDVQMNTVSNIQFYTTNYGIFANPIIRNTGGGFWPRGSQNQYLFAGGIWFAAMKRPPWITDYCMREDCFRKYVTISYNPNNGKSWMVPGRIDDGNNRQQDLLTKYRVYFSTDFSSSNGKPIIESEGESWPVWDASENPKDTLMANRYFGWYIDSTEKRSRTIYPRGPAFISGEDIFCTFKDTDLGDYDGGAGVRRNQGYPLRIQYEHTIYSWGYGDYKDFIYLRYDMINYSNDTLMNCWLAPVMDVDIALAARSQAGAANDRTRYYDEDSTKNLAVQWSNSDQGERGQGFGYLGFKFLESPSVQRCEEPYDTTVTIIHNGVQQQKDIIWCRQYGGKKDTVIDGQETKADYWIHFASEEFFQFCWESKDTTVTVYDGSGIPIGTKDSLICLRREAFPNGTGGFVRKDKRVYTRAEQLGLVTMRNWNIQDDPQQDEERYNFLSSGLKDGDNGAGDKRFMMATGPFHFRPRDTVRTIVAIILANPAIYEEADGSTEDLANLVAKADFAQDVYDDNFRAPKPPDRAIFASWVPYNNAIKVTWDSTSEVSHDILEKGLDFMGYRLYRARRLNLDTFDIDIVSPDNKYTSGKGPLGWKQIAEWRLPTPFNKSIHKAGGATDNMDMPFIDSLRVVGPVVNPDKSISDMEIRIMRVAKGIHLVPDVVLMKGDRILGQTGEVFQTIPMNFKQVIPSIAIIDTNLITAPWGKYYFDLWQKDIKENGWDPLIHLYFWNPFFETHKPSFLYDSVLIGKAVLNKALVRFNPLLYQKKIVKAYTYPDTLFRNDTFFVKGSEKDAIIDGNNVKIMDVYVKASVADVMRDTNHVKQALDSIYKYIQEGRAITEFADFENNPIVKDSIIPAYMRLVTNNRTFFDIGDDNRSGKVNTNEDPTKTEKLLNNMDYYYKILAYDEGDYNQNIERKLNDGNDGTPNVVKTIPRAAPVGNKASFEVMSVDQDKIGGLYNFEFFAVDQDRVNQLFANHTLELEFQPFFRQLSWEDNDNNATYYFGWYGSELKLTDKNTEKTIYHGLTYLEANPCRLPYRSTFTEKALSYILSADQIIDTIGSSTITFGRFNNTEKRFRSGYFSTGNFTQEGSGSSCYGFPFTQEAFGTFGFKFDFTIQQQGGSFRPDLDNSTSLPKENAEQKTPVTGIEYEQTVDGQMQPTRVLHTQLVDNKPYGYIIVMDTNGVPQRNVYPNEIYGGFNNGPGDYLITFRQPKPELGEGDGVETMKIKWNEGKEENTFNVPYLIIEVENKTDIQYTTPTGRHVNIKYPGKLDFIKLPQLNENVTEFRLGRDLTAENFYVPNPILLGENYRDFINKYNLFAYGFVNSRTTQEILGKGRFARPDNLQNQSLFTNVGQQGRYYLSATSIDGKDVIDFNHMLNISGCLFNFNHVGYKNPVSQVRQFFANWGLKQAWRGGTRPGFGPEYDFKPGDQAIVKTIGGASGYPLPGAKVLVKVSGAEPEEKKYTDKQMDQIQIVPNPYFITHQGVRSPYDSQIYFTKLPEECTIDIYTVTGDLIRSIKHDNRAGNKDRHAVEVWDLLSSNRQRVESQVMIAVITSPNGAQTIKEFAVVVGGYRLIAD